MKIGDLVKITRDLPYSKEGSVGIVEGLEDYKYAMVLHIFNTIEHKVLVNYPVRVHVDYLEQIDAFQMQLWGMGNLERIP